MESRRDNDTPVAEVGVTVAGCSEADARAVLTLLESLFPQNPGTDRATEGGHGATVWVTTLDAAEPARDRPAAVALSDTVGLTLQGGPRAVERVRVALAGHFAVEEAGSVSGDQEQEIGLRLRSA
ncbi:hypothetical protein AB4039_04075 [Streptomyces sp. M-16]|uniref:hypothetical protein n=1 Tax=Streptomyces sp. M-16 TaxID=3233040 RepID=UPI003F9DC0C5